MSGVSMCSVVWVGGREGALWLPAGGIRASQGTFSSLLCNKSAAGMYDTPPHKFILVQMHRMSLSINAQDKEQYESLT